MDITHVRRTDVSEETTVNFADDKNLCMKKELFLLNRKNKQNFILNLRKKLRWACCEIFHSNSDADVLIVQKAVEQSHKTVTIVVGEDTDLLVLLLFYSKLESCEIFLKHQTKKSSFKEEKSGIFIFSNKILEFLSPPTYYVYMLSLGVIQPQEFTE